MNSLSAGTFKKTCITFEHIIPLALDDVYCFFLVVKYRACDKMQLSLQIEEQKHTQDLQQD